MRIVLIGATGLTGREVLRRAIARGHHVTAIVRSAEELEQSTFLTTIRGDVFDPDVLAASIRDHDVIISALARGSQPKAILTDATAVMLDILKQMKAPPSFIVISQGLLFTSKNPVIHLIRFMLKKTVADSVGMETLILASDIDWTIVRPPRLTTVSRLAGYVALSEMRPSGPAAMNRADLAEFLLDEAEQRLFKRKIVGLTSR